MKNSGSISRRIIEVSGIRVEVVRKPIKNLHLSVHPPDGHVRVSAPSHIDDEAVRLAVVSKLPAADTFSVAYASQYLAVTAMLGGDYERAQTLFEAILEMARITGSRKGQATLLNNCGLVALCRGEYARAAKFSSESLRLSGESLDHQVIAWSLDALAAVWGQQGYVGSAQRGCGVLRRFCARPQAFPTRPTIRECWSPS